MDSLNFLSQYGDYGLLALRIALGVIFIWHGIPKLKAPAPAAGGMGLPVWFVILVGLIEVLGGLAILVGILERFGAIGVAAVMLGAMYMKAVKWKVPFSKLGVMGWEFDVSLLGGALAILFLGAGSLTLGSVVGM